MKNRTGARSAHPCRARHTTLSSLVLTSLALGACSTTGTREASSGYADAFARGDYAAAIAAMPEPELGAANEEAAPERDVLRLLHVAEAHRLAGDYQAAIESYDLAEEGLKALELENVAEAGAEAVGAALGGAALKDYEPYEAEKILINTYKALAYLSLGDADSARVEFNRVNNRSDRAMQSFEKQIAEAKKRELKLPDGRTFGLSDILPEDIVGSVTARIEDSSATAAAADGEVAGETADSFAGYEKFFIPASTYLSGLYNLVSDDRDVGLAERAYKQLTDVYPDRAVFDEEFGWAKTGQVPTEPLVWVLYENGQAPTLDTARADLDATIDLERMRFDFRDGEADAGTWRNEVQARGMNPYVLSVALPNPVDAKSVAVPLTVKTAIGSEIALTPFSDMGAVSGAEFDRRRPAMVMGAMVSAATKVAAQALAAKKAEKKSAGLGGYASRMMGMATAAATSADTRSWRALPARWEVARLARPDDGLMELATGEGVGGAFELPEWSRVLVYVKRPTDGTPLKASLIDLDGVNSAIEVNF